MEKDARRGGMAQRRLIEAGVDARVLELAGKLFRGDTASVARELVQNARRAGATRLWVDWQRVDGGGTGLRPHMVRHRYRMRFRDNGCGCRDPRRVLTLGGSGWGAEHAAERPAGMGMAVLAGKDGVRVHSLWPYGEGWTLALDEAAFTGARQVEVEALDPEARERLGGTGLTSPFLP